MRVDNKFLLSGWPFDTASTSVGTMRRHPSLCIFVGKRRAHTHNRHWAIPHGRQVAYIYIYKLFVCVCDVLWLWSNIDNMSRITWDSFFFFLKSIRIKYYIGDRAPRCCAPAGLSPRPTAEAMESTRKLFPVSFFFFLLSVGLGRETAEYADVGRTKFWVEGRKRAQRERERKGERDTSCQQVEPVLEGRENEEDKPDNNTNRGGRRIRRCVARRSIDRRKKKRERHSQDIYACMYIYREREGETRRNGRGQTGNARRDSLCAR